MTKKEKTKEFIEKLKSLMEEYNFEFVIESKIVFKQKNGN